MAGKSKRIIIIGAGTGGLSCAIALRRKFGSVDFTIFEKGNEVGGTWRDNIYPGSSCDIPIAFYSLSTDLRNWKETHGTQKDIHEYWISLAKKYRLYDHIILNRKVISARWDDVAQEYELVAEDTITGEQSRSTAHILISAIGVLETPRLPKIPGLESFKGEMFHSARWKPEVDLKGKRVGVVGNAASATQFVPCISEDPTVQVTQFCRTPKWIFSPIRESYSPLRLKLFDLIPFLKRLLRWFVYIRFELLCFGIYASEFLRNECTKWATVYIKSTAPEKYHDKLIPTHPLGCQRGIFDTTYLKALHQPNLEINYDGITAISETGILTKKEHIPLDVLIFATGFAADVFSLPVYGRSKSIQQYFDEEKGPKAYLGTTIPGFPNFFTIFGPNTATGHTSVVFTNEVQSNYILQLIQPILENHISSVEVGVGPTDAYNEKIQSSLEKSVWTQCMSWYRFGGNGKINAFPAAATIFWLWLRKPNWNHYHAVSPDKWLERRLLQQKRRAQIWWTLALGVVLVALNPQWREFILGWCGI